MPVVVAVAKFTESQKLAKLDLEVCTNVPILDGEKPEEACRKAIGLQLPAFPRDSANAVRYSALGASRLLMIDQKVRLSREEVIFVQQKYPNLLEVVNHDDADVDGGLLESDLRAERDAALLKLQKAETELAQLKVNERGLKARLEDAERRAAAAAEAKTLAETRLAGAESALRIEQEKAAAHDPKKKKQADA